MSGMKNGVLLVKKSGVKIPQEHLEFIGKINSASIPTRYPEDLNRMVSQYTRRTVSSYIVRTTKVLQWLRKQLPPAET